jgi:outer membrane protein OmpU
MSTVRRLLLGTTALAGFALWLEPAGAAEVQAGGALDIKLSGEARFITSYGNTDDALLDDTVTSGLDFFNDTSVDVRLDGRHDATGIRYGGYIEFQADTNVEENTDETWIYLRGGWGEAHLGDDDGVSSISAGIVGGEDGAALSAASVAAGTGGLDGDIVSDLFGASTYEPLGTDGATKISYVTPKFGGLNFGVSYTPNLAEIFDGAGNGDSLASKDVAAGDIVEGIAHYVGEFGEVRLLGSLSGLYGDIKDEDAAGGDDYWAAQAGAVVEAFGVSVGGSYLTEEVGSLEVDAVTLGIGAGFGGDDEGVGGFNVSLNYGQIISSDDLSLNDSEVDEPYTLVVSADYGIAPGLILQGDVAYFDNDVEGEPANADDDNGWFAVMALALEF